MKRLTILLVLLAVIVLLPALGRLFWVLKKEQPLNLVIVNKTVTPDWGNEMKALNWVLNYMKILKTGNIPYDFTKDYFGYHPDAVTEDRSIRSYTLGELEQLTRSNDGVIYLDNEGVDVSIQGIEHYGGFNQIDFYLLDGMMHSGKLVISEFNFFSDPTEDLIRYNTERLMDIYSLRWKGKFFENLDQKKIDRNIDQKWIDCYEDENSAGWNFTGPGLILCNEKQNRVLVLPADIYMHDNTPVIHTTSKIADAYSLPEEAAFTGWFDVVYEGGNEVISYIDLKLNEAGIELFKSNGLDPVIPATIKVIDKPVYFFAGDFSKQKVYLTWSKMDILSDLCRFVCRGMTKNPQQFFQTYYVPFMSTILEDYYRNLNKEES